jgi:hypothetical protein
MPRVYKKQNGRSPVDYTIIHHTNLLHFIGEDTGPSLEYRLHQLLVP